jgi:hypothetical protein
MAEPGCGGAPDLPVCALGVAVKVVVVPSAFVTVWGVSVSVLVPSTFDRTSLGSRNCELDSSRQAPSAARFQTRVKST